jgi:hypothetical protein
MTTNILALQKLPQLMSFTDINDVDGGSCTLCSHTCCCTAQDP